MHHNDLKNNDTLPKLVHQLPHHLGVAAVVPCWHDSRIPPSWCKTSISVEMSTISLITMTRSIGLMTCSSWLIDTMSYSIVRTTKKHNGMMTSSLVETTRWYDNLFTLKHGSFVMTTNTTPRQNDCDNVLTRPHTSPLFFPTLFVLAQNDCDSSPSMFKV